MSQSCKTCRHSERQAIERSILARVPLRRISTQRGGLSEASIRRHAAAHLPEHLARARDAEQSSAASDLLAELRALLENEREAAAAADHVRGLALEPGGDRRFALRAIETAGRSRERQARWYALLGELRGIIDPHIRLELDQRRDASEADQELSQLVAAMSPEEMEELAGHCRNHNALLNRVRDRLGVNLDQAGSPGGHPRAVYTPGPAGNGVPAS